MNDKLKFYRSTLVQMTKGLIGYTPMHKLAEDASKITEEIMKKVDEFEQEKTNMWSPNYDPSYNMTTTIIDNGPQYQANQKPYGTLGEHWKELSELFYIKSNFEHWKKLFNDVIIPDLKLYGYVCPRTEFNIYYYKRANDVYNSLGIEFIEDFFKACEKCEE